MCLHWPPKLTVRGSESRSSADQTCGSDRYTLQEASPEKTRVRRNNHLLFEIFPTGSLPLLRVRPVKKLFIHGFRV